MFTANGQAADMIADDAYDRFLDEFTRAMGTLGIDEFGNKKLIVSPNAG